MKAQFSIFGFTALLFTTAFTSPGSVNTGSADGTTVSVAKAEDPGFGSIRAHRQGKGVTTVWDITSSSGVVGFLVQKTYEDPTDEYAMWEDVSSLSCNGSRSYKCTDNSVYPG